MFIATIVSLILRCDAAIVKLISTGSLCLREVSLNVLCAAHGAGSAYGRIRFCCRWTPRHYVSHWQLTEYGTGTEPPTHPASESAHYGPRDIPPSGTPQKFSPLIALREKCCMSVRECNPEFTLSAPAGLKSSKPSMRTCPCVGPS